MPVLVSPDGIPFRTENPGEVVRLKARGYTLQGEPVQTFAEQQFHPADHDVKAVQDYLVEHPEEIKRVIAEEKAGKARVGIIGSSEG